MPPGPISKPQPTPIPVAPPRPTTLEKKPEPPKPLPGTGYSPKPLPNADLKNKLGTATAKPSVAASTIFKAPAASVRAPLEIILRNLASANVSLAAHPEVLQAALQAVVATIAHFETETPLHKKEPAYDRFSLPANDHHSAGSDTTFLKFPLSSHEKELPKTLQDVFARFERTVQTASQQSSPVRGQDPEKAPVVERLRNALEIFHSLPREERAEVAKLLAAFPAESLTLERFVEMVFQQASYSNLRHFQHDHYAKAASLSAQPPAETPSPLVVVPNAQVAPKAVQTQTPAFPAFQRITGVIAVDQLLPRLAEEGLDAQMFKTLLQAVLKAPEATRLAAQNPVRRSSVPTLAPIAAIHVDQVVKFIFSIKHPVLKKEAVEAVLRAWNHPTTGMKKLAVAVLKQLVQDKANSMPREDFDRNHLPYLKALARNRQSIEVRTDAIRVILDLEQHQGRNRREMEEILADVELVATLKDLLKAKTVAGFLSGVSLLSKAWSYLEASVRIRFVDAALERASQSSSEDVVAAVIDLVLTHGNDVENRQKSRIFEMDFHQATLTVAEGKYWDLKAPWSNFVGGVAA